MLFMNIITLFAAAVVSLPADGPGVSERSDSVPELEVSNIEARETSACYSGGAKFPSKSTVKGIIDYGCKETAGRYESKQSRWACQTWAPFTQHIDIQVKNIHTSEAHWTGVGACTDYLTRILNKCPHGGWIGTARFFYRIDPQGGEFCSVPT